MLTRTSDKYQSAAQVLRRFLGDPDKFAIALALARKHCEKARAYGWPEAQPRGKGTSNIKTAWNGANAAARKLAIHLNQLDRMTALERIVKASRESGAVVRGNVPAWLKAFASQRPRSGSGGYSIGPLRVAKASRKRPSPQTVLAVVLAHIFHRVNEHDGDSALKIEQGEKIASGIAWEAAVAFANEALSGDVTEAAAKKFMHDHRKHLSLRAWPKSRGNAKPLHPRAGELFKVTVGLSKRSDRNG